jgi:hypothetical protein
MKPRTEKITSPAKTLVPQFMTATMSESLQTIELNYRKNHLLVLTGNSSLMSLGYDTLTTT